MKTMCNFSTEDCLVEWDDLLKLQKLWLLKDGETPDFRVVVSRKQSEYLHETWPFDNAAPPADAVDLRWNAIEIEVIA